MVRGRIFQIGIMGLILFTAGATAEAQERATIQAVATVVSSLSVVGVRNLDFGTVTPGIDKSVDKTDVGFAGEWEITGSPVAEVTVDFYLPTELITADSLSTLPIFFNATDVSYEDGTGGGQTSPAGLINPNGPSTQNIGAAGTLNIWIGGRVAPAISQTGGDYSADILIEVAYTGS